MPSACRPLRADRARPRERADSILGSVSLRFPWRLLVVDACSCVSQGAVERPAPRRARPTRPTRRAPAPRSPQRLTRRSRPAARGVRSRRARSLQRLTRRAARLLGSTRPQPAISLSREACGVGSGVRFAHFLPRRWQRFGETNAPERDPGRRRSSANPRPGETLRALARPRLGRRGEFISPFFCQAGGKDRAK